jgi:2'-5' RNA ligase
MKQESIRCFVAVDLPDKIRDDIQRIQKEIEIPGVKLVDPGLVHITMKFLGDVPETKIKRVIEALEKVQVAPFTGKIEGTGAFPGRSIRVIWIGAKGDFAGLNSLVEKTLSSVGFKKEKRKFTAHATIARVRRPSPEITRTLAPKIEEFAKIDLGEFSVDRFFLKKSTLTPGGPIYDNLAEFPLRAAR